MQVEDGWARQIGAQLDAEPVGQDAGQVAGQTSSRDVAHRSYVVPARDDRLHGLGVEARRDEERVRDGRTSELSRRLVKVREHLARERVPVRVEPGAPQADDVITRGDACSVDDPLSSDDAHAEAREVVLALGVHSG